jgi:ABC-2 type transport system permease protein
MLAFFKHEIYYWLTRPMIWIFLLIITLLVMGAVSSDQVQIGGGVGNVYKNAPSVIQNYYGLMSLLCLLMTTAFMNASANRDLSTGMYQFVFTSPIKKYNYYFGKFFGAVVIAIIPLLGVSLGALLGPLMPWAQPERYGPIIWQGHWQGLLAFGIPNTIIAGVFLYSLAILFRSNVVSFVGAMLILVFYVVSQGFTEDIEKEWLANLLDPFGFQPRGILSKYKTIDELNASATPLIGPFLINRLYWLGFSLLVLVFVYTRFSFNLKNEKPKKKKAKPVLEETAISAPTARVFSAPEKAGFSWLTLWHLTVFEIKAIVRNQTFIVILIIGVINLIASLTSFSGSYGLKMFPVTYDVIDTIRGAFYLFLIGIITFYSGVIVWKERDVSISDIEDATPVNTGAYFTSKLLAMLFSIFIVLALSVVVGVVTQLAYGYTDFKLGVYAQSLLVMDMLAFSYLVVIALLMHYLINNRYIAYFAFVVFVILNSFVWSAMQIDSNMLPFGAIPFSVFSDMNGFGPFIPGIVWFNAYWMIASLLVSVLIYSFYIRGRETGFGFRRRMAAHRLRGKSGLLAGLIVLFLLCGGFVFYNTEVLNEYTTSKATEKLQKDYELTYKKYEGLPQPRWVNLDYTIDIHPYSRDLYVKVKALIVNKTDQSIPALHFVIPSLPDSIRIIIPGATLELNDERLTYRIYKLSAPLAPGDTLNVEIVSSAVTRGFENEVSFTQLTQNGTFFNNYDIMPIMGYTSQGEIADKNKRVKLGLPKKPRMPKLDEDNLKARGNTYISEDADWVNVHTVISTAADQIAVAPGSLLKDWTEGDRRYFEYQLDKPSLNFYSFISARYEVAREKWNDVDLEVYYLPEHAYNVPNMLLSMRKSLEYYTANFGPYYHKQCRIIEFPRYSSFAQAFPGTMPYSESIGFIADLRKVQEGDIDMVFYVVSHEMAHQYWAHQLIGANMQGSEMMSESFAQYSALMVMENEYGRDRMNRFLTYEMDSYLDGRGGEFEAERPLIRTEGQAYIHYNKASVVLYYLKEMIGEEQVNKALHSLIDQYAYQEPPYPTSLAALDAFKSVTPDSLQYLISDLFENITLFSNRIVDAEYEEKDGQYLVSFSTMSEKFRSDSLGKSTDLPINDYLDIGIFAQPEKGEDLGKPILYQRVKVTRAENDYQFTVSEKPSSVGIDPYHYLVDRITDDNTKKLSN